MRHSRSARCSSSAFSISVCANAESSAPRPVERPGQRDRNDAVVVDTEARLETVDSPRCRSRRRRTTAAACRTARRRGSRGFGRGAPGIAGRRSAAGMAARSASRRRRTDRTHDVRGANLAHNSKYTETASPPCVAPVRRAVAPNRRISGDRPRRGKWCPFFTLKPEKTADECSVIPLAEAVVDRAVLDADERFFARPKENEASRLGARVADRGEAARSHPSARHRPSRRAGRSRNRCRAVRSAAG